MISIVDTHFHIWDLKLRLEYKKTDGSFDWPEPSLTKIYRKFDASEAAQEMKSSQVSCAIFVQCLNGCPEEIEWVAQLAKDYPVIKGIVGGLDLTQDPVTLRAEIRKTPLLVGVRHILDVEDQDWLLREDVHRGLRVLEEEDKVFDCLVRPPTLKHVATIAAKFPRLRLVVDHLAKPLMSLGPEAGSRGWAEDLTSAGKQPNVFCKLSGMVTEVDPVQHQTLWGPDTFRPFVSHCLKVFGSRRVMFGSDWPVCKLAGAEHGQVVKLLKSVLELCDVDETEFEFIFKENALSVYKLQY